jgi:hypothetical protein
MSLHKFAEQVAAHGRGDDSLLVHMTPDEVRRLQAFAEANGTTMTINPDTGLPEAGFLSDLFKAVAPIALGAFLGPGAFGIAGMGLSAGTAGLVTGGLTTLATGSLSRGLMAGLGAYGGAGLAEGFANTGANAMTTAGVGDYASSLAERGIYPTLESGAVNPAFGEGASKIALEAQKQAFAAPMTERLSAGFSAATADPSAMGQFAKDNFKYLGMAAAPIMADMMVPTTTKVPELKNNASVRQYIRNEDGTLTAMNPVPAAGYGTPAFKPFAGGGIVALNSGGVPRYGGKDESLVDLNNVYANLGGKQVYDKISADYLKAGGTEAGLPSIFSKYAAAPAAVAAPVVAAPAAPNLNNIYANLGGKQVYDKIASDYIKAGGTEAGLPSILSKYDTPVAAPAAVAPPAAAAATLTPQQQAAMALMFKSSTSGVDTAAMDALGGADAVRRLATAGGFDGSATGLYNYAAKTPGAIDWTSKAGEQLASNYVTARDAKVFTDKFKTPADQALELMYRSTTQGVPTAALDALGGASTVKQLASSAGFEATPEWQQAYEKKMGYTVIPRMSTAESIALEKRLQAEQAAKDAATGTIGSRVTSNGIVDLKTDTSVKQDKTDNTTVGKSTLATTKPADIKSNITTDGTYTGTSGTPPAMNTLFGQGKFVGTGTEMGTGTTGPILDFGGVSPFGTTSPMALAQKQITDEATAKNAADKAKLDMYSQWGAANPKATNLEHANFVDKIGLEPAVAARLIGISPEQAQTAYNDAKYNKQTGDSEAAYRYLMGQGAYPTKSKVGEIARPYAEATLGYPASTNRQFIYDKETGRYNRNPDYVAEYKDATGVVNYKMSPAEVFNYFKTNAGQGDDATYSWAIANNLTPQDIANATGVPLSQIAPKWRAAVAKQAASKDTKTVAAGANTVAVGGTNYDITDKTQQPPGDNNGDWQWSDADNKWIQIGRFAAGGMPSYAVGGGLGSLGSYSDGGRLLRGPGDGVSDSIPATIGQKQQPARLADGEFVVPARIVSELGNGSTEAGAKKLYAMMDRVQRARGKTTGKNKVAANSRADKYLPA